MPEWTLIGLDLLTFVRAAMLCLNFSGPPTNVKECRGFFAGQPSRARDPFTREDNAHNAAVQSFLGVVIELCGKLGDDGVR
jgi:hypothetical protein